MRWMSIPRRSHHTESLDKPKIAQGDENGLPMTAPLN
jgi:hypothetical protein